MWRRFAAELRDFQRVENRAAALHCLNVLVTNALQHVPDVLRYMDRIQNQSVFNFCAIPQVSAGRREPCSVCCVTTELALRRAHLYYTSRAQPPVPPYIYTRTGYETSKAGGEDWA